MARRTMVCWCVGVAAAAILGAGCAKESTPPSGGPAAQQPPAPAPVPPPPAPAAPAPAPAAPAPAPAPVAGDYLAPGVQLAALRLTPWEDTVFMAKVYPVTVATPPSPATKGRTQVTPAQPIAEAAKATGGEWRWTPFVFRSHPAAAAELKVGLPVLCVDTAEARSKDELKRAEWRYRTIAAITDLAKGIVEVGYHDTYHHADKTAKVNVANVRVVDNPVPAGQTSFGK